MIKGKSKPKKLLLLLCFIMHLIYFGWRIIYTLPLTYGTPSFIAGILLLIAELAGVWGTVVFYITVWDVKKVVTPEVSTEKFPDVDVFIATYNEPTELLYKTIIGCLNMEYPDKAKIHIYVCDDGNRKEMKELCQKLEVGYITRKDNFHAKAGNLNNALTVTTSPCIVTFDADMIPRHNFLMKTIPFFLEEEAVGFVQVPQNFYNPDPFQYNLFSEKNIPNEQNFFFRVIQSAKNKYNATIYAGSNTVLSREALKAIGGFVTGTITEDFATGMMIQSKGYKTVYLNEILASGLSPETLEDLYNQRIRWGRGAVQTFKAHNPLRQSGLSVMQKIIYFDALLYWYFGIWRFIFLFAPILFILFNITMIDASALSMLAIWFPFYVITNYTFTQFTQNIRSASWSNIYDTILFPQITTGVIGETLGLKLAKFKVTPKDNVTRKYFIHKFKLVGLQIVLISLSVVGIGKIIYLSFIGQFNDSYIINFFWLVYNLYILAMAVFFSSERPKFRSTERMFIGADTKVKLHVNSYILEGIICNISETGLLVQLDAPEYINPNNIFNIEIITDRYRCGFWAELIRLDTTHQEYKYSFHIAQIDELEYRQLLLILYDRIPELPQEMHEGNTLFTNLSKNLSNRQKDIITLNRKFPRVLVNKPFLAYTDTASITIFIQDFNYRFCTITTTIPYPELSIPLCQKAPSELQCTFEKELSTEDNKTMMLYRVTNYHDIIYNDDFVALLKNGTVSNCPVPIPAAATLEGNKESALPPK